MERRKEAFEMKRGRADSYRILSFRAISLGMHKYESLFTIMAGFTEARSWWWCSIIRSELWILANNFSWRFFCSEWEQMKIITSEQGRRYELYSCMCLWRMLVYDPGLSFRTAFSANVRWCCIASGETSFHFIGLDGGLVFLILCLAQSWQPWFRSEYSAPLDFVTDDSQNRWHCNCIFRIVINTDQWYMSGIITGNSWDIYWHLFSCTGYTV